MSFFLVFVFVWRGVGVVLTPCVGILVVGIEAFVQEFTHLVHTIGLNVIHEFLQTGLHVERHTHTHNGKLAVAPPNTEALPFFRVVEVAHLGVQFGQLLLIQVGLLVHSRLVSELKVKQGKTSYTFFFVLQVKTQGGALYVVASMDAYL